VCLNHFSRHLSSARALIYMVTNMPPNNTVPILDQRLTRRIAGNFRLEEFALTLHPDKTRLIEFGRHATDRRARAGLGKPETFKFLGFVFICGKTRRGKFLVHRRSRRDRMRTKLTEIKKELRKRMHQPIPEQGRWMATPERALNGRNSVTPSGQQLARGRKTGFPEMISSLRLRIASLAQGWRMRLLGSPMGKVGCLPVTRNSSRDRAVGRCAFQGRGAAEGHELRTAAGGPRGRERFAWLTANATC
jgi:hypothetical protein